MRKLRNTVICLILMSVCSIVNAETVGEWLSRVNYMVSQTKRFDDAVKQALESHVDKDGHVDITFVYLQGVKAAVALYISSRLEDALSTYPSLIDRYGYISQGNCDAANARLDFIKAWSKDLPAGRVYGAYASGYGEYWRYLYDNLSLTTITNVVKNYIGSDWNE
jgi:hypothetical protein